MLMSMTGDEFAADELTTLEAHLAGTLKPVTAPRALHSSLRKRLRIPEVRMLSDRLNDWRSLVTVLGGVMSTALLIITVARALFFFFRRGRV